MELLGAGCALGGVGWDAVWVVLEGGALVGLADLGLGRGGGDFEGGVVVYRWACLNLSAWGLDHGMKGWYLTSCKAAVVGSEGIKRVVYKSQ